MRATTPFPTTILADDLTSRARLREAAILTFATSGFDASVRAIAANAGVTAGLITHHFGSKQAMRAECDEEVLRRFREIKGEGLSASPQQSIAMLATSSDFAPSFIYILRSVQQGGSAGRAFLEHLVAEAQHSLAQGVAAGIVRPSRDPDARARYLISCSIGAMIVQLTLLTTADLTHPAETMSELIQAFALPSLEVYSEPLLMEKSLLEEYLRSTEIPSPSPTPSPSATTSPSQPSQRTSPPPHATITEENSHG
jgi:AcrR family transcriptional regulator